MPLPFLAHQAAVLPLKYLSRRWSGAGLVLGSMAPDFGLFILGSGAPRVFHRPHGIVLYCLPLALALWWVLARWLAEPVARHLPRGGPLALERLAYLAAQPRTLRHASVVAGSILVGAGTHILWDLFTHHGTWMGEHITWLADPAFTVRGHPVVGTSLLWLGSTAVGGLVTLLLLRDIARRDLLRRWAEERSPGSTGNVDPDAAPATRGFWLIVLAPVLPAALLGYLALPPGFWLHEQTAWVEMFVRGCSGAFLGLCLASWRERRAWRSARAAGRVASGQGAPPVSDAA